MGLKKGMTNNKAGKPPGALNKLSRDMRQTITDFLQNNWPEVEKEFRKLDGKNKLNFYKELLQYAIPKMAAYNVDANMSFEQLTEQQLDTIIEKLLNNQK